MTRHWIVSVPPLTAPPQFEEQDAATDATAAAGTLVAASSVQRALPLDQAQLIEEQENEAQAAIHAGFAALRKVIQSQRASEAPDSVALRKHLSEQAGYLRDYLRVQQDEVVARRRNRRALSGLLSWCWRPVNWRGLIGLRRRGGGTSGAPPPADASARDGYAQALLTRRFAAPLLEAAYQQHHFALWRARTRVISVAIVA